MFSLAESFLSVSLSVSLPPSLSFPLFHLLSTPFFLSTPSPPFPLSLLRSVTCICVCVCVCVCLCVCRFIHISVLWHSKKYPSFLRLFHLYISFANCSVPVQSPTPALPHTLTPS